MFKKISPSSIVIILAAVVLLIPLQSSYADYDTFTVNVPNAQGGYTAIVIKQSMGGGYIGPQGEYYPSFPTVSQLQAMYGLGNPNPNPVITYVQPAPQPVQYDDEDQGPDYYRPVIQPNVTEEFAASGPIEKDKGNDFKFFEFKKKKKSKPSAPANVNPPAIPNPSSNGNNHSSSGGNPPPQQNKPDTNPTGNPDQGKKQHTGPKDNTN